jgi:uncharacterized protein YndB with AHSA1/START domain
LGFTIEHNLEIDAPIATVWAVITDMADYSEWNPFVESCRSTLVVGEPIDMRVRMFEGFAQSQREFIQEHVPGQRLCYGLAPMPLGALASRRCHEVTSIASDRTHYRSHFELSGWLAPVVRALLGRRLEHGFQSMSEAIGERAKFLATGTEGMQ